jgi:hypothetical protein
MKGNISIDRVSGKLNRLIHNFDFVTTLYDFYGFKGLSDNETKKTLEEKIKNGIFGSPISCKIIGACWVFIYVALFSMRLEGAVSLELLIVSTKY